MVSKDERKILTLRVDKNNLEAIDNARKKIGLNRTAFFIMASLKEVNTLKEGSERGNV